MGSDFGQDGPLRVVGAFTSLRRHISGQGGFANAKLIAGIALLAVISLLLQIQSGNLDLAAFFPARVAAKAVKSKPAKAPEILLDSQRELDCAAAQFFVERDQLLKEAHRVVRETRQAIAHMEPQAAATLLSLMDATEAVEVLAYLKEREISRILDVAKPEDGVQWIKLLLREVSPPEIPEQYREAARAAGLLDDSESDLVDGDLEETASAIPQEADGEQPPDDAATLDTEVPSEELAEESEAPANAEESSASPVTAAPSSSTTNLA